MYIAPSLLRFMYSLRAYDFMMGFLYLTRCYSSLLTVSPHTNFCNARLWNSYSQISRMITLEGTSSRAFDVTITYSTGDYWPKFCFWADLSFISDLFNDSHFRFCSSMGSSYILHIVAETFDIPIIHFSLYFTLYCLIFFALDVEVYANYAKFS